MAAVTEPDLVRISAVELLKAVREGRIRHPGATDASTREMVSVLTRLQPGHPVERVLVWRDPNADAVGHLLDGGDLVQALLRLADGPALDEDQAYLDTDTGEIVVFSQRPTQDHLLVELDPRFLGDAASIVESEKLTGTRAEFVVAVVDLLRAGRVLLETVWVSRPGLPRLLDELPSGRRGIRLADLDPSTSSEEGRSMPLWHNDWDSLIDYSVTRDGVQPSVLTVWRALLAAEGKSIHREVGSSPDVTADFTEGGRAAVRAVRRAEVALYKSCGYPRGGYPERGTVIVLARLYWLFPHLNSSSVTPLLRRWVWRVALAGLDLMSVAALLPLVHTDATDSMVRLLEALPPPDLTGPGRSPVDLRSDRGRLIMLGMADLHPRDLLTGELVDIDDMPLTMIMPERTQETANLLIHMAERHGKSVDDLIRDPATDARWLASHGIDDQMAALFRAGDPGAFLARRAELLDHRVRAFWDRLAEPGAPNRRPLDLMFADNDTEDDVEL